MKITKPVLLIYPCYEGRFFLKSRLPFPLGLLYIGAYLEEKGIKSHVKDFGYPYVENKTNKPSELTDIRKYVRYGYSNKEIYNWLKKNLDKYHDVIGVSSLMSTTYMSGYEIIHMIKGINKNKTVIIGGPHATAFPYHVAKNSQADYIVIGEGEELFYRFLIGEKNLSGIYSRNSLLNNKEINFDRQFIHDMDSLPFPKRHLLEDDRVISEMVVTFSRGCPMKCSFCGSRIIQGRVWRHKTVKRVVEEIKFYMAEWGVKKFVIEDDTLSSGIKGNIWLSEICDELKDLNIRLHIPHGIPVYATSDPKVCRKLWEAGFRKMVFPLESTDRDVLRDMNKPFTIDNWKKAVTNWKKYEKHPPSEIILGYPFVETVRTMLRTMMDISKEGSLIWPSYFRPNKGTELFQRMVDSGYIDNEHFDPIILNQISVETERFKKFDIQELLRISRGINFGVENGIDVFAASVGCITFSGYNFTDQKTIQIGNTVAEGSFSFKRSQDIFTGLLLKVRYKIAGKPLIKSSATELRYAGTTYSYVYSELDKILKISSTKSYDAIFRR